MFWSQLVNIMAGVLFGLGAGTLFLLAVKADNENRSARLVIYVLSLLGVIGGALAFVHYLCTSPVTFIVSVVITFLASGIFFPGPKRLID